MRTWFTLVVALAGASGTVIGQHLPSVSRTVYKCESGGKVVYSDEPCAAAKKIEIEPTRGLTTTGKERPGADVRNEVFREQLGEAVRPVTGMDSKQFEVAGKRVRLSAEAQSECRALDVSMQRAEAMEQRAKGVELAGIQADLLRQRKRFRALRC